MAPRRRVVTPEIIGSPECPILHRWTIGGDRLMRDRPIKLLLHHFMPNADDRDVHDHPRPFITLVLRGGYDDMQPCLECDGTGSWLATAEAQAKRSVAAEVYAVDPRAILGLRFAGDDEHYGGNCSTCEGSGLTLGDRMRAGMARRRRACHRHRTKVHATGCWTLVLMGPKRRQWGFWRDGRFWKFRDYEREFGFAMRCD